MAAAVFPWERAGGPKRLGRAARVPDDAVVPFPVAQLLRNRQFLWARRCKGCGRVKVRLAQTRGCSRSCGNTLTYFDPARERAQRRHLAKIGAMARKARARKADQQIARKVRGLSSIEAYRLAYERGYQAGHKAGREGHGRLPVAS
jgi:hypothetical protein